MRKEDVLWKTFDQAVQGILKYFVERDTRVIYFDGWRGFGASAVLRAVADQLASPGACPELRLDKVIHIDCSTWKSRRAMQRAIAVELKLDDSVMEVFDKADEEDDFNTVEEGSRGEIRMVAYEIDQALRYNRFMVVFHNGDGEDIDVGRFGIPLFLGYFMLWTFRRRFEGTGGYSKIKNKVKNTDYFIYETEYDITRNELLFPVLQKEATAIAANHLCMRDINPERIVHCCLYGLFLYLCLPKHLENDGASRASTYWMCDENIQGHQFWEISSALSKEIKWDLEAPLLDEVRRGLIESSSENSICCQRIKDTYFNQNKMSYPLIAITTSKTLGTPQDIHAINTDVSSCFIAPDEISNDVILVLADGLFSQSTNLHVLQLSHCAFSFASPPFIGCQSLRFLGLDHCKDNETTKEIHQNKWQFLDSLWVLDLKYTCWYQIFSEDNAKHLVDLRELNIVGVDCSHASFVWGQLCNLHKLEIVKPTYQPETQTEVNNSIIDSTKMELVDMPGNQNMKLPQSLRFFRFDNHEPPLQLSQPIQILSLENCMGLESLFLRQLPNLLELDLSGTAVKILDFTTMVVEVPCLKRVFLLGCEQLRAIKWDKGGSKLKPDLEFLCIDTRPGIERPRPSFDKNKKNFQLQIHAIIEDARLARSLCEPIYRNYGRPYNDVSFSIHTMTSTTVYNRAVEHEGTCKDNIGELNDQVNQQQQPFPEGKYHDVLSKVGDVPMQSFPQPPTTNLSRHIEIGQGSHSLESELDGNWQTDRPTLAYLMGWVSESLHVHDVSTSASMPGGWYWRYLRWFRIERCPNMETVFPTNAQGFEHLETIWVSDLLMARSIWSKGTYRGDSSFENLQHLHLRSCPGLQFILPVWVFSFPNLKTLHVIHCSNLRNIFVLNDGYYPEEITVKGVAFPKLTTIHLHDLPSLREICDVKFKMVAPALESIKIRGCWSLRRLPTIPARGSKPTVEIEKDVWDALEWDGEDAGHHPSLFEPPVHSRYYKKKLPRGSLLSQFVVWAVMMDLAPSYMAELARERFGVALK